MKTSGPAAVFTGAANANLAPAVAGGLLAALAMAL
jgi:hypothetical protein